MQLCRLLEVRMVGQPGFGAGDTPECEPVRFRPRPRMGFPAGEIAAIEFDNEGGPAVPGSRPTVRTAFMGLYGVDAVLPSHMIDEIGLREEGHEAVEAFLDQFNHRYVTLLYRAWKKYRYTETFRAGAVDTHSRYLLCLAGFGLGNKPARAGLPEARVLALLGLLSQRTRTPEGLAGAVAHVACGATVRVDELWPVLRRAGRPQPLSASSSFAGSSEDRSEDRLKDRPFRGLSGGYVLGHRLAYRSGAIRVTLRPTDAKQAHELLPGARLHRELIAFTRLYVGVKADVHLRMEVSSRFVPALVIGTARDGPAPRLAWTTVLPTAVERVITIALGVCEAFAPPEPNPYRVPSAA